MCNLLLVFYQKFISPILYTISIHTIGCGCRFQPTCSEYCKQAISKYGISLRTIKLVTVRLLRCQPFNLFKNSNNYGYDPLD